MKNFEKEKKPLDLPVEFWANETELSINQSIFVKDNNLFKKIELADIKYIQAYKNYLELQLEKEKLIIRSPLSKFCKILPTTYFQQIHRSFIVNLKHIDTISNGTIGIGLNTLPVSKSFKNELLKKLNFFNS